MEEFTGKEYLMIDIANNYGLDKKLWKERIAWFKANEPKLLHLYKEADKPALFIAGVDAYRRASRGEAIGYPISLDATHSGLQILSCLTGDKLAARLCNVINIPNLRADSYTIIFNTFRRLVNIPNIERDTLKKAIMTSFYSSKAKPTELLGERYYPKFCELLDLMCPKAWKLNNFLLKAWNPEALTYTWEMPDGFVVNTPVESMKEELVKFAGESYSVTYKVNEPKEKGRFLCANITHATDSLINREMICRCNYDFDKAVTLDQFDYLLNVKKRGCKLSNLHKNNGMTTRKQKEDNSQLIRLCGLYKKTGFLSVQILNYLNEENCWIAPLEDLRNLVASLPDKPFELISIHDAFRCLPNYGNDVRKQYRILLQQVADSNLLAHMLQAILGINTPINLQKDKIIVDGEYALS